MLHFTLLILPINLSLSWVPSCMKRAIAARVKFCNRDIQIGFIKLSKNEYNYQNYWVFFLFIYFSSYIQHVKYSAGLIPQLVQTLLIHCTQFT